MNESMIPTTEAARRLGIKPHTMRVWRLLGKGPRYTRYGSAKSGRVYYSADDVAAFKADRTFSNTAAETMSAAAAAGQRPLAATEQHGEGGAT